MPNENSASLNPIQNGSVTKSRIFFIFGALSAACGVAAGAFGAHALRDRLSPELMSVFETAVRYQMYHVIGLFGAAWANAHGSSGRTRLFSIAGWLFASGTLLFSGSLYLLSLSGERWFGAITPLGGVAFLAGWIVLAIAAWQKGD